jgi:CubicO group peptidase (beta-lactamase class C family)
VTKAYHTRPLRTPITVRQLLTHTAGFGYPFTSATLRDIKPREGETFVVPPLLFEPGTQWLYGTGVDYAGRIVEALSGLTLDAYFRKRIFRPLGMHDTHYNVPPEKQARIVPIHRRAADGALSLPANTGAPHRPLTTFNGGGGLRSTARDYARFVQMILNGGTLDRAQILSRDSVAEMGRNQIGPVGVRALVSAQPDRSRDLTFIADGRDKWGLGFLISTDGTRERRSAGSLSWGGINNTYFWIDPQRGVAGVVLMQFLPFADPQALEFYAEFERGVYRLAAKK